MQAHMALVDKPVKSQTTNEVVGSAVMEIFTATKNGKNGKNGHAVES